jgi:hypothetical protein
LTSLCERERGREKDEEEKKNAVERTAKNTRFFMKGMKKREEHESGRI